jgi:hypothetical protein
MNISYIIATYSGKDHTNNKELAENVLNIQIEQFLQLIRNKIVTKVHNYIHEIVIVCPPVETNNQFPNYYREQKWKTLLNYYGIDLKMVEYVGDNKHHSYDQWIQGWMSASKDSDYFILCEDDYYLDPKNLLLDVDIIYYYNSIFSDDIGYLATMVDDKYHGYHAAVSNGIVSRKTIQKLGEDALQKFYNIRESQYPQVNFSRLFLNNGIPIKDYRNKYKILFWNSYEEYLEDYSLRIEGTVDYHVFIPVQYVTYKDVKIVSKKQP